MNRNVEAFRISSEASRRQSYHYYGALLITTAKILEDIYAESDTKYREPRTE
jgi:hypothetical protein